MATESLILLSREPALYKTAAGWHLPDAEVYVFDEAAAALSRLAGSGAAVFVFDSRGFDGVRATAGKVLALPGDTDLVLVGAREALGDLLAEDHEVAIQVVAPDASSGELQAVVQRLLQMRRVRQESGIFGRSRAVVQMLTLIAQAAPLDVTVLIQGESGTGKELVARAIHDHSPRRAAPFISLNCGAMAEGVLESELFGHARGAFTGAVAEHAGVFRRADGGTLFLDEVGEMPLGMQTRFLRALETGEFTPVGGKTLLRSNIRLVAATNRDLARDVEAGRFRPDLYYRLRVIVIPTPALRERKDDIPILADHFLRLENQEHGLAVRGFSRQVKQLLRQHSWPGNIRELRNVVRAAAVMKQRGLIEVEDLPAEVRHGEGVHSSPYLPALIEPRSGSGTLDPALLASTLLELHQDIKDVKAKLDRLALLVGGGPGSNLAPGQIPHDAQVLETSLRDDPAAAGSASSGDLQTAERLLVAGALRAAGGNRRRAAQRLGISERTLYRKIKRYEL
jgi:DNA-binding NtrC family response regulator